MLPSVSVTARVERRDDGEKDEEERMFILSKTEDDGAVHSCGWHPQSMISGARNIFFRRLVTAMMFLIKWNVPINSLVGQNIIPPSPRITDPGHITLRSISPCTCFYRTTGPRRIHPWNTTIRIEYPGGPVLRRLQKTTFRKFPANKKIEQRSNIHKKNKQ